MWRLIILNDDRRRKCYGINSSALRGSTIFLKNKYVQTSLGSKHRS